MDGGCIVRKDRGRNMGDIGHPVSRVDQTLPCSSLQWSESCGGKVTRSNAKRVSQSGRKRFLRFNLNSAIATNIGRLGCTRRT